MYKKTLAITLFFITLFLPGSATLLGQIGEVAKEEADTTFTLAVGEDSKPTIELNPTKAQKEVEEKKEKVKKRKKNAFYGLKSKKRYIRSKKSNREVIEIFYVLRHYQAVNKFVKHKYYYDHKERKIVRTNKVVGDMGNPLHGTYLQIVNGDTTIQGIYYIGTRHGRWVQYFSGEYGILRDKKYYYKGFPKDAHTTYWDTEQTRPKEVIPYQMGRKDGWYLRYYASGRLAETGLYDDDHKINIWYTYYDHSKNKNKQQVRYPSRAWIDQQAVVIRVWDDKGKMIKGKRRRN